MADGNMTANRMGRILAFQAIYSWDVSCNDRHDTIPDMFFDFDWLEPAQLKKIDDATRAFSRLLITGTV